MKLDSHEPTRNLYPVPRKTPPGVLVSRSRPKYESGPQSLGEMNTEVERHDERIEHYTERARAHSDFVKKARHVMKKTKALLAKTDDPTNRRALEWRLAEYQRDLQFSETKVPAFKKLVEFHTKEKACYLAQWKERRAELEEERDRELELRAALNGDFDE